MHSMSKKYYNFLVKRLVDWLKNNRNISAGDRLFALFDDKDDVKNFYSSLQSVEFEGKTEFYDTEFKYQTIALEFNGLKYVFMVSSDQITHDFLVTLRNRVANQAKIWQNTVAIFIDSQALDSIVGGAFDVSQIDAPFNVRSVRSDIETEVNNTELSLTDKKIVKHYLNSMVGQSQLAGTLKDFETVFSVLESKVVTTKDFNSMGYFPDKNLTTFSGNDIDTRLTKNAECFDIVEMAHDVTNKEDVLNNHFAGGVVNELATAEDWREVEFSKVQKAVDEFNKDRDVQINYAPFDASETTDWLRSSGETNRQRKTIYAVYSSLTQDTQDNTYTFEIKFDDNVQMSNVVDANSFYFVGIGNKKQTPKITNKGKKLQITIEDFDAQESYGGMITYKHKGVNRLTFKYLFAVLPIDLNDIKALKPDFKIDINKGNKTFALELSSHLENYDFTDTGVMPTETISTNSYDDLSLHEVADKRIDISLYQPEENESEIFEVFVKGKIIPIKFGEYQKAFPQTPDKIEQIRLQQTDLELEYIDEKVIIDAQVIYLTDQYKNKLAAEKTMLITGKMYGEMSGSDFQPIEMKLPTGIEQAYTELFNYYRQRNTLPSIAVNTPKLVQLIKNVLNVIQVEWGNLNDDSKLPTNVIANVANIGRINTGNGFYLTAVSPIQLAYQLELSKNIVPEYVPDLNILASLNPTNLVPYVDDAGKFLMASYSGKQPRWLRYQEREFKTLTDLSAKIIKKRLDDYTSQYAALFNADNDLALNIAVINIFDEDNLFDALINHMLDKALRVNSVKNLNGLNIYFKNMGLTIGSKFTKLYQIKTIEELNELLVNKYKKPTKLHAEEYEIIDMLKQSINVFTNLVADCYYHIAFYQVDDNNRQSTKEVHSLDKNYALNGLVSNRLYIKDNDDFYINGFGVGQHEQKNNQLLNFAKQWNAFVYAANNPLVDFKRDITLIDNVPTLAKDNILPIMQQADWVTIINPEVDLSYFFNSEDEDIMVIHYLDQNGSANYEAVTITSQLLQYDYVIQEKLSKYRTENKEVNTKNVIKSFNILNGEWLLKLASDSRNNQGSVVRAKLSMITAFKQLIGILSVEDITWIPISLEDVFRVADMIGLNKKDGVFSAKTLKETGPISDDLLMLGIDYRHEKLRLQFVTVEVKVGKNASQVHEKAVAQLKHATQVIKKYLGSDNPNKFMQKYYANFFANMLVANIQKIRASNLISKDFMDDDTYNELTDKIATGDYTIGFDLESVYGQGMIFEFTQDLNGRSIEIINNEYTKISVPEKDAYEYVDAEINQLVKQITTGKFDFNIDNLLCNREKDIVTSSVAPVENLIDLVSVPVKELPNKETKTDREFELVDKENKSVAEDTVNYNIDIDSVELSNNDQGTSKPISIIEEGSETKQEVNMEPQQINDAALIDKRILIGKAKDTATDLYWEYGNKELANRHMLITGKSGQGKTYYIQTLLYELAKQNINSIVIDYTDGFLPNQLETEFNQRLGNKIDNRFIFKDKLPLNPFKLGKIDFGGFEMDEDVQDMVDRVAQVIDFVFKLGTQQMSIFKTELTSAYKIYGDKLTFKLFKERLLKSDNATTLLGRISELVDRDPFDYESGFSWAELLTDEGVVHIFQLKGYQQNIQRVMIEFMLWDLWDYLSSHGSKDKPIPIILDEVQNLNFNKNAPTVKILQEGRKYGWSGIFATQQIKSITGDGIDALYNVAEMIHFLPPENQVTSLAKIISPDATQRNNAEMMLKNLKKGQAVIYGPNRQENNTLTQPEFNVVNIQQFEERK